MEFKDKFIAFIDVLGFKEHVKAAERGAGMSLPELLDVVQKLGSAKDRDRFLKHGPNTCPHSTNVQRDLDFRITQISDCAIVSAEVSPAGLINLVSHCWGATIELLYKGVLCRGYITRGSVYHTDNQVIGSGYQSAYESESKVSAFASDSGERGTPFVEIDPTLCEYVKLYGDECVKMMFARYVKTDGDVTALFPFQRLSHGFMIGGSGIKFDAKKELESNNNLRISIGLLKQRILTWVNPHDDKAMTKVRHYIRALDVQLEECDKTDRVIHDVSGWGY